MNDSVITTSTVTPQKRQRKNAEIKESQEDTNVVSSEPPMKSPIPEKKIAKSIPGKKFVYFSSGSGYVTKSGFKFSSDRRIYELEEDEADHLLSLSNFRLPDQLELEEYYKENK